MGQYLSIGIVTELIVSKAEMQKGKISKEELLDQMEKFLYFPNNLYTANENDDMVVLKLKSDVFSAELIPFLEKFYKIMYRSKKENTVVIGILEKLKNSPPSDWMEIAKEKSFYYFQEDLYGRSENLTFEKEFQPRLNVQCDCIMLSMEGKTFMEVYGRQFHFFKYCMREAFQEFALSGALRVYLSG
ncbi:MAG: hypothetical protein HQM08_16220 [Candidatus Riflebacteria bacterium]|nr:hypothetical protein [Candidatus Riflebacteria bacterium]